MNPESQQANTNMAVDETAQNTTAGIPQGYPQQQQQQQVASTSAPSVEMAQTIDPNMAYLPPPHVPQASFPAYPQTTFPSGTFGHPQVSDMAGYQYGALSYPTHSGAFALPMGAQQPSPAYTRRSEMPGGIPMLPPPASVMGIDEWECPDHRGIVMLHRGSRCRLCVEYTQHVVAAQHDPRFQQVATQARVERQRVYFDWFEQHQEGGRGATTASAEVREENARLRTEVETLSTRLEATDARLEEAWTSSDHYRAKARKLEDQLREHERRRSGRPTSRQRRSESPRPRRGDVERRIEPRSTQRERRGPTASSSSMPGPFRTHVSPMAPQASTDMSSHMSQTVEQPPTTWSSQTEPVIRMPPSPSNLPPPEFVQGSSRQQERRASPARSVGGSSVGFDSERSFDDEDPEYDPEQAKRLRDKKKMRDLRKAVSSTRGRPAGGDGRGPRDTVALNYGVGPTPQSSTPARPTIPDQPRIPSGTRPANVVSWPRDSTMQVADYWYNFVPATTLQAHELMRSAREHGGGAYQRVVDLLAQYDADGALHAVHGLNILKSEWRAPHKSKKTIAPRQAAGMRNPTRHDPPSMWRDYWSRNRSQLPSYLPLEGSDRLPSVRHARGHVLLKTLAPRGLKGPEHARFTQTTAQLFSIPGLYRSLVEHGQYPVAATERFEEFPLHRAANVTIFELAWWYAHCGLSEESVTIMEQVAPRMRNNSERRPFDAQPPFVEWPQELRSVTRVALFDAHMSTLLTDVEVPQETEDTHMTDEPGASGDQTAPDGTATGGAIPPTSGSPEGATPLS